MDVPVEPGATAPMSPTASPTRFLVTARDYLMATHWCHQKKWDPRRMKFVGRLDDLQFLEGHSKPVKVYYINEGPTDEEVRHILHVYEAQRRIDLIKETI